MNKSSLAHVREKYRHEYGGTDRRLDRIDPQQMLTLREAAKVVKVLPGTIYYAFRHKIIRGRYVKGRIFLEKESVEAYHPRRYKGIRE